jgi:hypothetical protein
MALDQRKTPQFGRASPVFNRIENLGRMMLACRRRVSQRRPVLHQRHRAFISSWAALLRYNGADQG